MTFDRFGSYRQIDSSETGAAAVEFALILPVLLLILFGVIAFGDFFSRYQVFQSAVREGARAASTRSTPADVRSRIADAADPYDLSATPSIAVASGGSQCTDTTVGERVTVQWSQEFDISLPFIPAIDNDVQIRGVFRCE
jgi:Flp pilus assembly protein TadG